MWQSHIAPPFLALLLAVALVLTGCGQSPDSKPGTAAPTVDTVDETASNPTTAPAAPGSVATAPAPTKEARPSSTIEPALVRAPDSTATRLAAGPGPNRNHPGRARSPPTGTRSWSMARAVTESTGLLGLRSERRSGFRRPKSSRYSLRRWWTSQRSLQVPRHSTVQCPRAALERAWYSTSKVIF